MRYRQSAIVINVTLLRRFSLFHETDFIGSPFSEFITWICKAIYVHVNGLDVIAVEAITSNDVALILLLFFSAFMFHLLLELLIFIFEFIFEFTSHPLSELIIESSKVANIQNQLEKLLSKNYYLNQVNSPLSTK